MRFLISTFIVASILENHGTFQGQVPRKRELLPVMEIELFKEYVIELVNAAIPALRTNNDIMEQGCACIRTVRNERQMDSLNLILATMSIAKNYHENLQLLRLTDLSTRRIELEDGMKEAVIQIITILVNSEQIFHLFPITRVLKQHLLNYKPNSSTSASKTRDSIAAKKCYRFLLSMCYKVNARFFKKLARGFELGSQLLMYYDSGDGPQPDPLKIQLQAEFNSITGEIFEYQLVNPHPDFKRDDFETFVRSLNEN